MLAKWNIVYHKILWYGRVEDARFKKAAVFFYKQNKVWQYPIGYDTLRKVVWEEKQEVLDQYHN